MEKGDGKYAYTYSSKQNEEINNIISKYILNENSKLEQLRRLDQRVTRRGKSTSIILGIISLLFFGIGMCCTMLWSNYFVVGIVIGVIGIIGMSLAYPIYNCVIKNEREKVAEQVIALGNELMQ